MRLEPSALHSSAVRAIASSKRRGRSSCLAIAWAKRLVSSALLVAGRRRRFTGPPPEIPRRPPQSGLHPSSRGPPSRFRDVPRALADRTGAGPPRGFGGSRARDPTPRKRRGWALSTQRFPRVVLGTGRAPPD